MWESLAESLFNFIGVGVIFYGILMSSLLLFNKSIHKIANRKLAVIIFIGIWYVLSAMLFMSGKLVFIPSFFRIGLPAYYAVPPLIYWYIQTRLDKDFQFKPIYLLHLLPVLLTVLDSFPFYFSSTEKKEALIELMTKDFRNLLHVRSGFLPDYIHFFFRPIQGLFYIGYSFWYLKRSSQDKKLAKEYESQPQLKTWFLMFLIFFALIYFGLFMTNVVWSALPYSLEKLSSISLVPSILTVILFLGLHVFIFFNQHLIFGKTVKAKSPIPLVNEKSIPEPTIVELSKSDKNLLLDIEKRIKTQELFKNPKLTAPELAALVGIPPHTFSQLINTHHGKHFPDFINTFRIQYALNQFDKGLNDNLSIEGIATESGFASRSAFYNAFKKITGLTPSVYIRQEKERQIQ